MASIFDRVFGRSAPAQSAIANLDLRRAADHPIAPYATAVKTFGGGFFAKAETRRAAKMLRRFARTNEFVRIAIERRRDQVSQAGWRIVRIDDPERPPDPRVVKQFTDLTRYVNPKGESFAFLLDAVVEDILVLDAGCIVKEKTYGGQIYALWSADGALIVPDPNWDGTDVKALRYRQYLDGVVVASWTNDEFVYIQNNPTTYSPIGWSPVETLVKSIETDLWGEQYDSQMLRNPAPAGVIDLGAGMTAEQVEAFRLYYDQEIQGSNSIAIYGGGMDAQTGIKFVPFAATAHDQQRMEYKLYVAKKIASVFKLDPMLFGITAGTNRSTSKTQKEQTDEGHVAFAKRLQTYITREIVWEFDQNHGFEFNDLTDKEEMQQSQIDATYLTAGVWTINEVRARDGLDPVDWGDEPYASVGASVAEPAGDEAGGTDPNADPNDSSTNTDQQGKKKSAGAAKRAVPFAGPRARTDIAKRGYLGGSPVSLSAKRHG